jgi:spore germination protein GerM
MREGSRLVLVSALLLALLVLAGGLWVLRNAGPGPDEAPVTQVAQPSVPEPGTAGDRAVLVAFPRADGAGYVTEERLLPSRDRPAEDLLGVMQVLCAGPRNTGAISALPPGTRALAAFMDPGNQAIVLDFSRELSTGHPGGSLAEAATLTSILRTVALNFSGTRSCTILIEGSQVETLAGHVDLLHPFDPQEWL